MFASDSNTMMAYARMLRMQAAERERIERRRPRRPRYDDAAETPTTQPRAVQDGLLGAARALLGHPVVALRWHGRPRQAS
jgi:hypothetical protein